MDPCSLTDNEPAFNIDPGSPTNTESAPLTDPGLNMDIIPVVDRCVNCGADVMHRRRHSLDFVEVQSVVRRWIAPQTIEIGDIICHPCWTSALSQANVQDVNMGASTSSGRHRRLCVNCGCSLIWMRSHRLHTESEREARIRNIILTWISPTQLGIMDEICHPCWQRSDRVANRPVGPTPPRSLNQPSIILPNFKRAADSESQCFVPECNSLERLVVPKWLRIKLFSEYKFYVPINCRICSYHLYNDNWQLLDMISEPIHSFMSHHIEDFATFLNERKPSLDFSNIETMSEALVHFWIGMSKEQFDNILTFLTRLRNIKNGKLALAAYLLKLRTGDSDDRISVLLNVPRSTLTRLISNARQIISEDFVPQHLGINHITRAQIAARNLTIPNGLFGGEGRPIIIMDGTYLYIQKSSNYMYQKDTYSLHKYRNLMKPFIIVCTDGYIIDVLGPYPATTSDASIIIKECNEETKPLRQYFQTGDVFILDRGFRDCVPLLESLNYRVLTPASREEGEMQLSTLAANRSRTVTICRWVVEAVNGLFKQCFKLLRHEFCNKTSSHAMTDFKVAAALINRFHQRIRDREDAELILNIVNTNLYRNNELADFITENNLNRRRTQFQNINVNIHDISFPRLEYEELILFACGTLKQARSYYGEHIRGDGSYSIEVCREGSSNLLEGLSSAENGHRLLRAKIKSRHISRKVYYIYIIYDTNNMISRESIKQYACNCIVGRRTIGCCAHVMTIVWYLSWARYQNNVNAPAQFLDNILLTYDSD